MIRRKPTINDYVYAILNRDNGDLYSDVLGRYDITADQFGGAVNRILENYVQLAARELCPILEAIAKNPERRKELFNMGEEFVKQQYDRMYGKIPGETQTRFYKGTFFHSENIDTLVYYALTFHNRALTSTNRKKAVRGIKNLPHSLAKYLQHIKLAGLMSAFEKGEKGPWAVLEIFDKVYQRKVGDKSLFDLTQKEHLHRWGDNLKASNSYWQNSANVEEAVYHILTENNPVLASSNREKVIKSIKCLPSNLVYYLYDIGLSGLMANAFVKGKMCSPLAVLEVFDRAYRNKTGDKSLFDLTQKEHLHRWGDKFQLPHFYWRNEDNKEEAVYHILTENHPLLAYTNRRKVIEGIKNLPSGLSDYFYRLFSNLMNTFEKGEEGSPLAVLKIFDKVYQRKAGDKSLFDKTQDCYL